MESENIQTTEVTRHYYLVKEDGDRVEITPEQAVNIFQAEGLRNPESGLKLFEAFPGMVHTIDPQAAAEVAKILRPPVTDRIPFFSALTNLFGRGGAR